MAIIPTQKIERLRERAARLEREGNAKRAEWERYRGDVAFLTQPAGRGSAFGRRRQRIFDRYVKGGELLIKAQELRAQADRLETYGIPEKGDAERRRQRRRDAADTVIAVGSRVSHPMGGFGTVLKVNKKTYRVEFDRGFTWTEDKSFFKLLVEPGDREQVSA